jgi:hypothetical protein
MILWTLVSACTTHEEAFPLETWGCGVESEVAIGPAESLGSAPAAELVIAELDGAAREVSFHDGRPGFDVAWSDVVSFSISLGGVVRAATLVADPNLPSAWDCVAGEFLFADVEVGLSGQHFSGSLPGVIRWRGPDPYEDLWLVLEQGQVDTDDWLSDRAENLVQLEECEPFSQVEVGSYDTTASGTWGNLDLDVWAAGHGCWLTMAQATWLEASLVPEG